VDRQDYLTNPIGVCGKELTIILHLLFSRSIQIQNLILLGDRINIVFEGFYPSGLAALHGLDLPSADADRQIIILASECVCHILSHEKGAIQDYRSILIAPDYNHEKIHQITDFVRKAGAGASSRVFITGEASEEGDWVSELRERMNLSIDVAPSVLHHPNLHSQKFAVTGGLYQLSLNERKPSVNLPLFNALWKTAGSKVKTFAHEYF
jgi:hypothetical protein